MISNIKRGLKKFISKQVSIEINKHVDINSKSTDLEKIINNLLISRFVEENLLIVSMPKSGTNLIKLVLTNYINEISRNKNYDMVTYETMNNELTLSEKQILSNERKNLAIISNFYEDVDFGNILHSHSPNLPLDMKKVNCNNFKVIYLSRHPLDSMISSYFYHYKNREGKENIYTSPSQYLNKYISGFANKMLKMQEGKKLGVECIYVTYENLILSPFSEYKMVIEYLGLKYDRDLLEVAIENSSIDSIKKQEKDRGKPIHADFKLKGSFVRSGKVGQFKDHLSELEIEESYRYLESKGLETETWKKI